MKKRLDFKTRDHITGEIKNTGYVEMRSEEDETEGEQAVELYFYGDIGGTTWEAAYNEEDKCPKDIQEFFDAIPDNAPVNVYMNSGGGDAYAGIAISNIISRHKGKTTGHVDGLAASAASVIVSGCDRVIIHTGGQFMMHKPLTIAWGNADDFKDAIKRLNACQECITDVYMKKTKPEITRDQITKLINAETWLGATAAQKYFNFEVDDKTAALAANSSYYGRYRNAPQDFLKYTKPANNVETEEERKKKEMREIIKSLDKYGA